MLNVPLMLLHVVANVGLQSMGAHPANGSVSVSELPEIRKPATHAEMSTIFWVVMPCSSEKIGRFEGIYRLHLQYEMVSPKKKPVETGGELREPRLETQA
jgi:hypothetical protein